MRFKCKNSIADLASYLQTDVKAISAHGIGSQGQPPSRGALFSHGSVQVKQATSRLAVVNAGSNTVQLFDIDPKNPLNITTIGEPVPSGGDFPQSIAWNNAGTRMCVLNGGLKSTVQYVPIASTSTAVF